MNSKKVQKKIFLHLITLLSQQNDAQKGMAVSLGNQDYPNFWKYKVQAEMIEFFITCS